MTSPTPITPCTPCQPVVGTGYSRMVILGISKQEIARKFDEIVDFAEMSASISSLVKMYLMRYIA
jgi:ABC-type polysaccharide/polyol phosphate transport system ATPase subunit